MAGGTWILSDGDVGKEVGDLNYYERHIGDYIKDTAHLSLLEHGVYARLLDVYYSREAPIPGEQVYRLVGAKGKDEKAAVDLILAEFFLNEGGSWRQKRCDEVISEYHATEPEREARKQNEAGRVKRHREERSKLFACLNSHGEYPAWNVGMAELRALHKGRCNGTCNVSGSTTETVRNTYETASHSPVPVPVPNLRAEPPSGAPVPDPRKAIFDLGVSILGESKRGLIGKAVSQIGETKVAEVIAQMAAKPPVGDPSDYFAKATQKPKRGFVC